MDDKIYFEFCFETDKDAVEISTPLYLCKPHTTEPLVLCNAIWDTGATSSMISAAAAKKLQLTPVGITQIAGVHGISNAKCYHVDVYFGNGFCLHNLKISEASNFGGFDLLVGMDVIGKGDLLVGGANGDKLHVRFLMPIKAE